MEENIEDDENVCTICYGNKQNAKFIPCSHLSCEQLIIFYSFFKLINCINN